MLKNEREKQILDILTEKGYMSVNALSKMLFASESSIRRDLTALEKKGYLKRSYGGAELIRAGSSVLPFDTRAYTSVEEKRKIAKKAVSLINDGDVIFLDQSSTCYFLAIELSEKCGVTVITNSLVILSLLSRTDIKVICSGGMLSSDNRSCLVGEGAAKTFSEIYADIMFFSAKSLSFDGIISDCTQEEIAVRNAMMRNAAKKVFLCNGAKFGTKSPYIQCSLSDIDCLVSEEENTEFKKYCETY